MWFLKVQQSRHRIHIGVTETTVQKADKAAGLCFRLFQNILTGSTGSSYVTLSPFQPGDSWITWLSFQIPLLANIPSECFTLNKPSVSFHPNTITTHSHFTTPTVTCDFFWRGPLISPTKIDFFPTFLFFQSWFSKLKKKLSLFLSFLPSIFSICKTTREI